MTIKVFGSLIKIEIREMGTDYSGFYVHDKKKILIEKNYPDKFHTIIHEIFHSCWFRTGMTQTKIPNEVHEIIVENFATVLVENWDKLVELEKKLD